MKKCSKCGRAYSDMVSVCPVCKVSLDAGNSGHRAQSASGGSQSYTPPQPYSPPTQNTYTPPQYTPVQTGQTTYTPPQHAARTANVKEDKAGFLWVILSALLPILGLILYFCWKKNRPQAAKSVSTAALVGIVLAAVLRTVTGGKGINIGPVELAEETAELAEGTPGAYRNVFTERGIVHIETPLYDQETAHYVHVNGEGVVDVVQYGYNGDVIETMVNTVYFPIENGKAEDKPYYDEAMLSALPGIDQLSFVSYSSEITYSYYCFKVQINDLDVTGNIRKAADIGIVILDDDSTQVLSIEETEQSMLEQGYIKR